MIMIACFTSCSFFLFLLPFTHYRVTKAAAESRWITKPPVALTFYIISQQSAARISERQQGSLRSQQVWLAISHANKSVSHSVDHLFNTYLPPFWLWWGGSTSYSFVFPTHFWSRELSVEIPLFPFISLLLENERKKKKKNSSATKKRKEKRQTKGGIIILLSLPFFVHGTRRWRRERGKTSEQFPFERH